MTASRKAKIKELIQFDKKLAKSYLIIGTDEAGRGPVAGPVTASAVYFEEFNKELIKALEYLDDSKKFSSNPKLRKELSIEIKNYAKYSICSCTVEEIDKYNILQASLLAMRRACEDVLSQIQAEKKESVILVDGKISIPQFKITQQPVVKGDSKSASIAAASILAKVHRDEFMAELSQEFPQYNWLQNKGYPTAAHLDAIREHGPCIWHRKTFLHKVLNTQLKIL